MLVLEAHSAAAATADAGGQYRCISRRWPRPTRRRSCFCSRRTRSRRRRPTPAANTRCISRRRPGPTKRRLALLEAHSVAAATAGRRPVPFQLLPSGASDDAAKLLFKASGKPRVRCGRRSSLPPRSSSGPRSRARPSSGSRRGGCACRSRRRGWEPVEARAAGRRTPRRPAAAWPAAARPAAGRPAPAAARPTAAWPAAGRRPGRRAARRRAWPPLGAARPPPRGPPTCGPARARRAGSRSKARSCGCGLGWARRTACEPASWRRSWWMMEAACPLRSERRGRIEMVGWFKPADLAHGFDGWLPLHAAAALALDKEALLPVLEAHTGAAATADAGGQYPLHSRCRPGHKEALLLLLEAHSGAAATPTLAASIVPAPPVRRLGRRDDAARHGLYRRVRRGRAWRLLVARRPLAEAVAEAVGAAVEADPAAAARWTPTATTCCISR